MITEDTSIPEDSGLSTELDDLDGDGHPFTTDCDDNDDTVYPGAPTGCVDGDANCDGVADVVYGGVWSETPDGTITDQTALFETGTEDEPVSYAVNTPQTLNFCPGTWHTHISVTADATIRGLGGRVTLNGAKVDTLIQVQGNGLTVAVERLWLLNGYSTNELEVYKSWGGTWDVGGGIYCEGPSTVLAKNLYFEGNNAQAGAAIYAGNGCALTLNDSTIRRQDSSTLYGAGLFLYRANAELTDVNFHWNRVNDGQGGSMYLLKSELVMRGGGVFNNVSYLDGGGIYLEDSQLDLDGVRFMNQKTTGGAPHYQGDGGALYIIKSDVTMRDTLFKENEARDGGALFLDDDSTLEATTCNFIDNHPEDLKVDRGEAYDWGFNTSFTCAKGNCMSQ